MALHPLVIKVAGKLLEMKLPFLLAGAIGCLVWFQSSVQAWIAELFPSPSTALVAVLVELILSLILILVGACFWYRNKHTYPRPDLKKKTDLQELILKFLSSESMPCNLARKIGSEEQLVIHNLELLAKALLVARNGAGATSWHVTEHGRTYLFKKLS